jgi:hypothetical protein
VVEHLDVGQNDIEGGLLSQGHGIVRILAGVQRISILFQQD